MRPCGHCTNASSSRPSRFFPESQPEKRSLVCAHRPCGAWRTRGTQAEDVAHEARQLLAPGPPRKHIDLRRGPPAILVGVEFVLVSRRVRDDCGKVAERSLHAP